MFHHSHIFNVPINLTQTIFRQYTITVNHLCMDHHHNHPRSYTITICIIARILDVGNHYSHPWKRQQSLSNSVPIIISSHFREDAITILINENKDGIRTYRTIFDSNTSSRSASFEDLRYQMPDHHNQAGEHHRSPHPSTIVDAFIIMQSSRVKAPSQFDLLNCT